MNKLSTYLYLSWKLFKRFTSRAKSILYVTPLFFNVQVAMLESELGVMEQARDKLEGLVEGMEARLGEVTNTAGLEAMLEAEEREERRAQEAIFDLNIKYNKVVRKSSCLHSGLQGSVCRLLRIFAAP